jgi:hypothetical protein
MLVTPYFRLTIADLAACPAYPASPWLAYGGSLSGDCLDTVGIPGVKFNSPIGYSEGQDGLFTVIQVINNNITNGSGPGGNYSIGPWNNELDGFLPYGTFPGAVSDTPMTELTPYYTNVNRNMIATTFLMWQSPPPSIAVPLGYQQWTFSGMATCSTDCELAANWIATTNGNPHLVSSFTTSDPSQTSVGDPPNSIPLQYGYPAWIGDTDDH